MTVFQGVLIRSPLAPLRAQVFYTRDILTMYRAVAATHGATFVFHDTQPDPIYSYCVLDGEAVTAVREKVKAPPTPASLGSSARRKAGGEACSEYSDDQISLPNRVKR